MSKKRKHGRSVSRSPRPAPVQDHRPKAGEVREVTVQGLRIQVDPDLFDDFEVLDQISRLESGDPLPLPALLRKIAGDRFTSIMDHLRDPGTGRVPAQAGAGFVLELMRAAAPSS